jgi:hypothetical protein
MKKKLKKKLKSDRPLDAPICSAWSRALPDESGLYWWRACEKSTPILCVVNCWHWGDIEARWITLHDSRPNSHKVTEMGGLWSGPISPPNSQTQERPALPDALDEVTEQRDEARRLAKRYRDLSCDTLEEADETLLPWEITSQNEP